MSSLENQRESNINDAIFGGLLGIVFLFFSLNSAGLILEENIIAFVIIILLFISVAIIRMLEIMLHNKPLIYSIHFFRLFVLPTIAWAGSKILVSEILHLTKLDMIYYYYTTIISFYLLAVTIIYLYKIYIAPHFTFIISFKVIKKKSRKLKNLKC